MNYTSNLQSLWKEIKNYLELQKEYLSLDATEKLTLLLSAMSTTILCVAFGLIALSFFVIALALWLANAVGNVWSFVIMGGVMLLMIVLVLIFRKKWIVQPLTRFIAGLFVGEDEEKEDEL